MPVVAWGALATAVAAVVVVVVACCWHGLVGWAGGALARRRAAEARAEALLLGWLSPRQREQYRWHGWFDVVTPGGHLYRIRPGTVVRLDARGGGYCIEAVPWAPAADQMLAKKLLLETDERRFLATAHRYR